MARKKKDSFHRHPYFYLGSVMAVLAVLVIVVALNPFESAVAGEAIRGTYSYTSRQTYAPPTVIQQKDTWTESELKAKVKETLKEGLTFRRVDTIYGSGHTTCEQVCKPSDKYVKQPTDCLGSITVDISGISSSSAPMLTSVGGETPKFTQEYYQYTDCSFNVVNNNDQHKTLCVCI